MEKLDSSKGDASLRLLTDLRSLASAIKLIDQLHGVRVYASTPSQRGLSQQWTTIISFVLTGSRALHRRGPWMSTTDSLRRISEAASHPRSVFDHATACKTQPTFRGASRYTQSERCGFGFAAFSVPSIAAACVSASGSILALALHRTRYIVYKSLFYDARHTGAFHIEAAAKASLRIVGALR